MKRRYHVMLKDCKNKIQKVALKLEMGQAVVLYLDEKKNLYVYGNACNNAGNDEMHQICAHARQQNLSDNIFVLSRKTSGYCFQQFREEESFNNMMTIFLSVGNCMVFHYGWLEN